MPKPHKMLVCFHWAHSTLNGPFKIWLLLVIFDSNCPPSLAHTENLVAFVISAELRVSRIKELCNARKSNNFLGQ